MKEDLVSVVIPCYRQAHLLPKAIKSCIDQTFQNIEVIIVDDGSPDNVADVIMNFHFDSRVKLVRQKNMGLSAARNTGILKSNGNYIKFLDSDDWLLSTCIEHQYNSLYRSSNHISVIGYSLTYDDFEHENEDIYPSFGKLSHALCYLNTGPPHTFLYPTETIKEVGGFSINDRVKGGHEDYDLLCKIVLRNYEAISLQTIGCVYRQSANSMSTNLDGMRNSRSKVWQYFAENLLQKELDPSQIVHLFGGYATRLSSKDFRYEAFDIFNSICFKLHSCNNISQESLILLCTLLAKFIINLPNPCSIDERVYREKSLNQIFDLISFVLARINTHPILKGEKSTVLLNTGSLMMQNGVKKGGEKLIRRALDMPPYDKTQMRAISLLNYLSRVLPGSLAVYFWRNIGLTYKLLFE